MSRWLLAGLAAMLAGQALALSTIEGRVTKAGGTGISGVTVQLRQFSGSWWDYGASTTTDSSGNYRLPNLSAGTYRVGFEDLNGNFVAEYYNDARDVDSAQDIVLGPSETRSGVSALLAPASKISGQLTTLDGTPAVNVDARAYAYNGSWWQQVSANASSDGTGVYTIGGLPAGTYHVEFTDWNGNYVSEYYDDASSLSAASDVVVGTTTTVPNIDASLAPASRITGKVTRADGNTPLQWMRVEVKRWNGIWWETYYNASGGDTGADGIYTLGGLPAGTYRVEFSDWNGDYATEWYNDTPFEGRATSVNVPVAATVPNINASIAEAGRISGTVTGTNGTTPLSGINVQIYAWSDGAWTSLGNDPWTASDGSYTAGGLPTGSYRLRFQDWSGQYLAEWYDNVTDETLATAVNVVAGATADGRNASLSIAGKIRGKVTGPGGTTALPDITATAYRQNGTDWDWTDGTTTDDTGVYELNGLPAGTYRVEFSDGMGNVYATEWYNDKPDRDSANDIVVASGATVMDINASLATGGRITGKVFQPNGTTPIAGVTVSAFRLIGTEWMHEGDATTGADGAYALTGLATANYRVRFMDQAIGLYITEWHNNAADRDTGADVGVVAGSTVPNLNATLAVAGFISGTVTGSDGTTPLTGISIEVIAFDGTDWNFVNDATTDSLGRYQVGGLRTGNYRVGFMSGAGAYKDEWYDDKADSLSANDVAVTAGATTPNIDASLASALPQGGIAGTVVVTGTGTPLSGLDVYVCVKQGPGAWTPLDTAQTQADGTYAFGNIDAGTYFLRFHDSAARYTEEWYNDKANIDTADGVVVMSGATTVDIDAELAPTATPALGSVAGTVTAAVGGSALASIQAIAERWSGAAWVIADTAVTGADGKYQLTDLAAGTYRIRFHDASGGYADQWYDHAASAATASPVFLGDGDQLAGYDAALASANNLGSIGGTVSNTDGSAGLSGIEIMAYRWNGSSWVYADMSRSGASGAYTIVNLQAGEYRLRFYDGEHAWATEWYDDVLAPAEATAVPVAPADDVTNIDAFLAPAIKPPTPTITAIRQEDGNVWAIEFNGAEGIQYQLRGGHGMDPTRWSFMGAPVIGVNGLNTLRFAVPIRRTNFRVVATP